MWRIRNVIYKWTLEKESLVSVSKAELMSLAKESGSNEVKRRRKVEIEREKRKLQLFQAYTQAILRIRHFIK